MRPWSRTGTECASVDHPLRDLEKETTGADEIGCFPTGLVQGAVTVHAGPAEAALPDREDAPTQTTKPGHCLRVPFCVAFEFLPPPVRPSRRDRGQLAAVEMPEAAVHEDCGAVSRKDEVRSARQVPAVETVAKSVGKEPPAHFDLDPGVAGPDGRHHPTSRRCVHRVGQDVSPPAASVELRPAAASEGAAHPTLGGVGARNGRPLKKPTGIPFSRASSAPDGPRWRRTAAFRPFTPKALARFRPYTSRVALSASHTVRRRTPTIPILTHPPPPPPTGAAAA